jgi:hypothetical protein
LIDVDWVVVVVVVVVVMVYGGGFQGLPVRFASVAIVVVFAYLWNEEISKSSKKASTKTESQPNRLSVSKFGHDNCAFVMSFVMCFIFHCK